ncbi:hypothetical protein BN183_340002 [Clostridioides difficile E7]|nr:hypothetical protein BN181_4040004 [Clostridioides difficile T17]CCL66763.1 hypothetical protein BN183_340002 [Clostridioides difficile E7]
MFKMSFINIKNNALNKSVQIPKEMHAFNNYPIIFQLLSLCSTNSNCDTCVAFV